MSAFRESQAEAARARRLIDQAQEKLDRTRNRLHQERLRADAGRRAGDPELREVLAGIERLEIEAGRSKVALTDAKANLGSFLAEFPGLDDPQAAIENLNDSTPFLLLPVRVETRFMTANRQRQLWVRIFPDDVAVHTHEKELTPEEVEAGRAYWLELYRAARIGDDSERETREQGAWRRLAGILDGSRAAWVARSTRPESLEVSEEADLAFPEHDPETLKPDAWSRAPRSRVMPDRFVVSLYSGGKKVAEKAGELIPDPLVLGPEPSEEKPDLEQVDGELAAAADLRWIYEFDRAVANGMGLILDLESPFDRTGFDRLLVLGLRLSADADEGSALVEELIDNHHYAADGMAFLAQGTPTNNTDSQGSGFGSLDPGAAESFATETGEPNLPASQSPERDGHRLAEALGIGTAPLAYLAGAGQTDVTEAHALNKALWPATLGYYLEEMLQLDLDAIHQTRGFFVDYVTGRGPLPAVRVGTQPYGVLLTSDFSSWQWERETEGSSFLFLEELKEVLTKIQATWRTLAEQVPHVDASGDKFKNLLRMLGLHATSVEFHRRNAVGKKFLWNYLSFNFLTSLLQRVRQTMSQSAETIVASLGLTKLRDPDGRLHNKIFDLAFFFGHDDITDPLVDDVASRDDEVWSESEALPARYRVPHEGGGFEQRDYIGWLIGSDIADIKRHAFRDAAGEKLAAPRAVLYRMLRRALLLAYHDASMNMYVARNLVTAEARREIEFANIAEGRTVTRWEFLEADVQKVAPDLSEGSQSVVSFLQTPAGLALPESRHLREVRDCLAVIEGLPTARLERLFAEHLDLCSYRLDAWQGAFFTRRLESMRGTGEQLRRGVYLGCFGWLEDVRPGPELEPVDPEEVPIGLRNGSIVRQRDNGGFIHGPSINHAVAAAVLRNAYLTHADEANADRMSVNLSSERVRTALSFLEGIRNGQELGALLGYQFERGLHDRHNDPSLNQFILPFRTEYPLVADKITPDESGEQIETKEARNVFDGYALLEKAVLAKNALAYPYGVDGLPAPGTTQATAIVSEVERMEASFDAIADLATAEGVFQVTQGNYDRGGAMLKAFTQGNNPPEPEIAHTPRSGLTISNRVTLHVAPGTGGSTAWPGSATPRSLMEPGLNAWLAELLGPPAKMRYLVTHEGVTDEGRSLADLGLQPIDLVLGIGDSLDDQSTDLELRIEDAFRVATGATNQIAIGFMTRGASWAADDLTLFEVLPLLRGLRELVTGSRPLSALDYLVEDEADTDPANNPEGYDELGLEGRLTARIDELDVILGELQNAMVPTVDESGDEPAILASASAAHLKTLRDKLRAVSLHGIPDSLPVHGAGDEDLALLARQAVRVRTEAAEAVAAARLRRDFDGLDLAKLTIARKIEEYREAARLVLGAPFNALPDVTLANGAELAQATAFRDPSQPVHLTRHHANPLLVEEWLQGVARVREKVASWEGVRGLAEALHDKTLTIEPLQLPFRETDHWLAVEYPEAFEPEGQYLSVMQHLTAVGFDPLASQRGLVLDDWTEVIPNRTETTGLAVHYDQPNSEPPQTLLLAVPPAVTGSWQWDQLQGILNDTLERAAQRAVEPDMFAGTGWGHLLPAVITAVTSYPWATISTDLVSTSTAYTLAKFDEES